jgi:hypothetical protein
MEAQASRVTSRPNATRVIEAQSAETIRTGQPRRRIASPGLFCRNETRCLFPVPCFYAPCAGYPDEAYYNGMTRRAYNAGSRKGARNRGPKKRRQGRML